ncbi:MAG: hypothetical protein LBF93_04715, partial [Zoogloeaceae bacterium]|nr:hypothetical protein [Zoogloeaceae bacterium]
CYLGARSLPRSATGYVPARHAFVRHARPFVFLPSPRARVVYWGPDGRYGGTNANDACLPTAASDDVVICL